MKSRVPGQGFLIRVASIGVCIACVFAFATWAGAAHDDLVMSVDSGTPLAATLMPSVSVSASAVRPGSATMRVGDESPLAVTLLPTVHVSARQ